MNSQHLRGVRWWDWVLSHARYLAQHFNKQTRGWNGGVLAMQRALATSSPTCLSSAAGQILKDSDASYHTAQQGHRALTRLIDREKDGIQHAEVLQMLRMSLSGPNPYSEAPEDKKHSSKQVLRLLQQLQQTKTLGVTIP